jgi:hypothetical protein
MAWSADPQTAEPVDRRGGIREREPPEDGAKFPGARSREETYLQRVVVTQDIPISLGAADLVFCDSITVSIVCSRSKVHYRLIAADCLEHIAASLSQH